MRHLRISLAILALSALAAPASACNVPVFRFALEHFPAEPYQVTLYHRGALSKPELARIAALEEASPERVTFVSIDLERENVDDAPKQLPWLVVRYPQSSRLTVPIWQGPLADDMAALLLDSAKRKDLVRRLLAGDSAIWILLESGDAKIDDETAAQLEAHSRRIEKTLKLPVLTKSVEDRIRDDVVPFRLSFSVLRVSRTDPAERLLVRMLLGIEPDLEARTGPLVFPVFGRGRALFALAGKGINEANLTKTAEFLTSACSCKVKEAHPGVDLLLTGEWPEAPDDAGLLHMRETAEEPMPVPLPAAKPKSPVMSEPTATTPVPAGPNYWLIGGIVGAALLTVVTGRLVWRGR